jgi:hypothetical protein
MMDTIGGWMTRWPTVSPPAIRRRIPASRASAGAPSRKTRHPQGCPRTSADRMPDRLGSRAGTGMQPRPHIPGKMNANRNISPMRCRSIRWVPRWNCLILWRVGAVSWYPPSGTFPAHGHHRCPDPPRPRLGRVPLGNRGRRAAGLSARDGPDPRPIRRRRSLGIAIVGGLLLSQALTLYTTPVVYVLIDRLKHQPRRSVRAVDDQVV